MPVGLTFKKDNHNKYAKQTSGEIMLVHMCLTCGSISTNRIAGDDNPYAVLNLLNVIDDLNHDQICRLEDLSLRLLALQNRKMVATSLFGYEYDQFV